MTEQAAAAAAAGAAARVDALAVGLGYRRIGGLSNLVYLHPPREEILKVGGTARPEWIHYKLADFARCREVSAAYAPLGLMPEVLEVGDDFRGTGFPFLRERYVRGENLARAYLADPHTWTAALSGELGRIYRRIAAEPSTDVGETYREKLDGIPCPEGCETLYQAVQRSGRHLLASRPRGHRLHGDLQFGNIVATRDAGGTPRLMLIDWEVSEVMPLGYELPMLYNFLHNPLPQVEEDLRPAYAALRPLRDAWRAIVPAFRDGLEISREEFEHWVRFRMGGAWLGAIAEARERGDASFVTRRAGWLRRAVSGELFETLPYT